MTKKKSEPVATCIFLLEELRMKKDKFWRLKLTLKTQLPESFREYGVRLSLNEEPYNIRIEDLNKRYDQVEAENQLFGEAKKKQLKQIKDQIADVEKEMEEAWDATPDIEFDATIEALQYKDGDTVVVMMIPAPAVVKLNEQRSRLGDYKVELLRD